MRILNSTEFLACPPGTVYAVGGPWHCGGYCIKGETDGQSWYEQHISALDIDAEDTGEWVDKLEEARSSGADEPLAFNAETRVYHDGAKTLYFVLSPEDVAALINALSGRH
jgi:hypothetical protein